MISTLALALLASDANAAWAKDSEVATAATFARIGDICESISETSASAELEVWGHTEMVNACEKICLSATGCTGFDVGFISGKPTCTTHTEGIPGAYPYPTCDGFSNMTDAPGRMEMESGTTLIEVAAEAEEGARWLGCYKAAETSSSGSSGSTSSEGGCDRPSGTSRSYGLKGWGECRMKVGRSKSYPLKFDVSSDAQYDLKIMPTKWKQSGETVVGGNQGKLKLSLFPEIYEACVTLCDDFADICKGFELVLRDGWSSPKCRLVTDYPTYTASKYANMTGGMDFTWGNRKTWFDCGDKKMDTIQTYANGGGTNYGSLNSTWKAATFGGENTRINNRDGYFCFEQGIEGISYVETDGSSYIEETVDNTPVAGACDGEEGVEAPVGVSCHSFLQKEGAKAKKLN